MRATFAAMFSLLAGAALWACSPILTGQREPWDGVGWFYPGGLFLIGVGAGWLAGARRWWWSVLWASFAAVGQMVYVAVSIDAGPLVLIGVGFVIASSVVTLAGGCIPALWFWGKTGKLRG